MLALLPLCLQARKNRQQTNAFLLHYLRPLFAFLQKCKRKQEIEMKIKRRRNFGESRHIIRKMNCKHLRKYRINIQMRKMCRLTLLPIFRLQKKGEAVLQMNSKIQTENEVANETKQSKNLPYLLIGCRIVLNDCQTSSVKIIIIIIVDSFNKKPLEMDS